jgi:phosphatidylglycerol:prolipoprotein diacylglycerol transferase
VYVGAYLAVRHARRIGLSHAALSSFIVWVVALGFVSGHVLDLLLYSPQHLLSEPSSVLELWEGQSSFGGFIGALVGMLLWRLRYRVRALPYADVVASAFPVGWLFGRAGCAVAHDHPGLPSEAWYAVAYPGGGRFDLGLYEMVLTIPLVIGFAMLKRARRPWGFYLGAMAVYYAPIRFALDSLRARDGDARYGALTPAQWLCGPLLIAGLVLLFRSLACSGRAGMRIPPAPPAFRDRARARAR